MLAYAVMQSAIDFAACLAMHFSCVMLNLPCMYLNCWQHVYCAQDAEELIKIVPGLTDGYYHKVRCSAHARCNTLNLSIADVMYDAGFCPLSPR